MMTYGLMDRLFHHGQENTLEQIFLHLDPSSLKACRCVCSQWNIFILAKLWGTKVGRKKLMRKLMLRWRESKGRLVELARTTNRIISLHCDDRRIYCGYRDMMVAVYNIQTGELERSLNCGQCEIEIYHEQDRLPISPFVEVDGNANILAAATTIGIFIWSKIRNMDLIYKKIHMSMPFYTWIKMIKVTLSKVVVIMAGGLNMHAYVLEEEYGRWEWKQTQPYQLHNTIFFQPCACDDLRFVNITNAMDCCVRLWSQLEAGRDVKDTLFRVIDDSGQVHSITLTYPHLFAVVYKELGTHRSLEVWNMATSEAELVRQIGWVGCLNGIICNKTFMVLKKIDHIEIYSKEELCDPTITDCHLWNRRIDIEQPQIIGPIATNTTSIVITSGKTINVLDFWIEGGSSSNVQSSIDPIKTG